LAASFRKTQPPDRLTHGCAPVSHRIHPRDEVQILGDTQIFVKTEALGHVAYMSLDDLALGHDVVAQAGPLAIIGTQESAQHAKKCRLAASIGSEKSTNLAGAHLQIDVIDRKAIAESLRHLGFEQSEGDLPIDDIKFAETAEGKRRIAAAKAKEARKARRGERRGRARP